MSEDMNRPATHGDLGELRIAISGDIAGLKTDLKGNISELRTELKGDIQRVAIEMAKIRGEMADMKYELSDQFRDGNNRILNALSEYSARVQTIDRREVITSDRVDKLENRIKNLEGRA